MRMSLTRLILIALTTLLLAACGGGGGGGFQEANGPTITLEAPSTLPAQPLNDWAGYYELTGFEYHGEIIATVRDGGGRAPTETPVHFTVKGDPNKVHGALYTPDETESVEICDDAGNCQERDLMKPLWGYSQATVGGTARMSYVAWNRAGTVTIEATFQDPATGQTATVSREIRIGGSVDTGLPSTLTTSVEDGPVYITGQGRNDRATIVANLRDANGQPVVAPADSANNLRAEIVGDSLGSRLVGANGAQGTNVTTRSIGSTGRAEIPMLAGTAAGTVKIRLTADGADNNVDNGIQQAITHDLTVLIQDGRAASVTLTGPYVDAIRNNQSQIELAEGETLDNGTYSRILTAVVQDREGNPVPNATVRFGLIDSPIAGFPSESAGQFVLSGTRGNPTEGGDRFDQEDGVALIDGVALGGGATARARQGDQLILYPNEQGDAREMTSRRSVDLILDNSRLLVQGLFPAGQDVGANIPWTIGRAQYGNIIATATTDQFGVASTLMTYPVARVGQNAIVTAEAVESGATTVFAASYAGIRALQMTSSHTEVTGNGTTSVTMCVRDANDVPLPNYTISVGGLGGNVVVNTTGEFDTGNQPVVTGANGCATFSIVAQLPPGAEDVTLLFSVGQEESEQIEVTVKATEVEIFTSIESATGTGTDCTADPVTGSMTAIVTATFYDAQGVPVAGAPVSATMEQATSITVDPSVTNDEGQTTVTAGYPAQSGTVSLEISTTGGNSTTVTLPGCT
ncbi:MAG: Ig-like domain-containing protein [Halothiobacillaceae bacterium]